MAVSNTFSITVQASSVLAQSAASLSSGQSAAFGYNPLGLQYDIQWMTVCMYYDAVRKELQYMGKPASSQSTNHRHYIYDEITNTWRTTGQTLFPGTGHIWSATFDHDEGNYYFHRYADNYVYYMRRSVEAGAGSANSPWTQTATGTNLSPGGNAPVAAVAYHPNLYGAGLGGLVDWSVFHILHWRESSNTWTSYGALSSLFPSLNLDGSSGGGGCYLPGLDVVLLGAKNNTNSRIISVAAGSSGTPGTPTLLGSPPIPIEGVGGGGNGGKMLVDPSNSGYALILETISPYRYWRSTNGGSSWSLVGNHPFTSANLPSESTNMWTCGAVPAHGIVWGLSSNGNANGGSRIWKPA